jgi:hypothetical protein
MGSVPNIETGRSNRISIAMHDTKVTDIEKAPQTLIFKSFVVNSLYTAAMKLKTRELQHLMISKFDQGISYFFDHRDNI